MRKLFVLLMAFWGAVAYTQTSFLPYSENAYDGKYTVQKFGSIGPDYQIGLAAEVPYYLEKVTEDSILWYIYLYFPVEKDVYVDEGWRLMLKLGDSTNLTLRAREKTTARKSGYVYYLNAGFSVVPDQLERICQMGVVKWRMELSSNFKDKSYTSEIIGKTLSGARKILKPAILQQDVWQASITPSVWKESVKRQSAQVVVHDQFENGIHHISVSDAVMINAEEAAVNALLLTAEYMEGKKDKVNWMLRFDISNTVKMEVWNKYNYYTFDKKTPDYRATGLFHLGNGKIIPFENLKGNYNCQFLISLSENQLSQIVETGVLKIQMSILGRQVVQEYQTDKVGAVIRSQYNAIKQTIDGKDAFESNF